MRNLFLELKTRGKTIIIATHIAYDVKLLCDEVYKMDEGQLTEEINI